MSGLLHSPSRCWCGQKHTPKESFDMAADRMIMLAAAGYGRPSVIQGDAPETEEPLQSQ